MLKPKFLYLVILTILLPNCGPKITNKFWQKLPQSCDKSQYEVTRLLKKQPKDMSFDEAEIAKIYYEEDQDDDMVIRCGQRLLAVGGDQETMRQTTLQLAQLHLDKNEYDKAQKYAHDYQEFFPGTDDAIKAKYIGIKANFLASPNAHRDQTKTEKTIELAQNFLDNHKEHKFTTEVKEILEKSYEKLIDREIAVATTYLNRFQFYKTSAPVNSALRRIEHIKKKLLPHNEKQKNKVADLEIKLAKALGIKNLDNVNITLTTA